MEYELDINGKRISLDVAPLDRGTARVNLAGQAHDLEFQRISDACFQIRVNGRQVHAWVTPEAGGKRIALNGRYFFVKDCHLQDQTGPAAGPGASSGARNVTPPMPAVVIQVPVSVGDKVAKGDTVVVVSAMKMETSLTAPYGGVITRIKVKAGDKVMPGEILADIEPDSESANQEEAR